MNQTEQLKNILFEGCKSGDNALVEFLLHFTRVSNHKNRIFTNLKNSEGKTPLMIASENGKIDVVKLLSDSNADLNLVDNNNNTSLILAVKNGHKEIATFLLDQNVEYDNNFSDLLKKHEMSDLLELPETEFSLNFNDFLNTAVQNSWLDILKVLVQNDIAKDSLGIMSTAIQTKNIEIIQLLLDNKYPVHNTDLIIAIHVYNLDIVKLLLEHDSINIKYTDAYGFTPLMYSVLVNSIAKESNVELIEFLLEKGSNINFQNNSGFTALLIAIDNNNKNVVDLLMKAGADITLKTKDDKTVFTLNEKLDHEIREILERN